MTPQVAVVGAGYWGKNLIRNFQELGALRVICDSSPPLLESYAATYPNVERTISFADVLADGRINAVVIATPAVTHSAVVKAALQVVK